MSEIWNKIRDFALWTIGGFFLLGGIVALGNASEIAPAFILIGLIQLPPIRNKINGFLFPLYQNSIKRDKLSMSIIHKIGKYLDKIDADILEDKLVKIFYGVSKFGLCLMLFILVLPPPTSQSVKVDKVDTQIVQSQNKYENNKNTSFISKKTGFDRNVSAKIYEVLVNCGVGDIYEVEPMQGMNEPSFFVYDNNINNPIRLALKKDGNVDMVVYDTWTIYEKGKRVDHISNYNVSFDDKISLQGLTKENIRKFLTYPQGAKFNSDWSITKMDGVYALASSVDVKNALGTYSKEPFNFQYKKASNGFELTYAMLGGELIYKKAEKIKPSKDVAKETAELERLMGIE